MDIREIATDALSRAEQVRRRLQELAKEAVRMAVPKPGMEPDEGQLEERARLGMEAERYLTSDLMRTFHAQAEAKLVDELTRLPIGDDAGRRNIAIAIQTQRAFWGWLAATTKDGRQAAKRLEDIRTGKRVSY